MKMSSRLSTTWAKVLVLAAPMLAVMVGLTGCATAGQTRTARLVENGQRPGRLEIVTPEVFELVMVAVALAEKDQPRSSRIWRGEDYYDRVLAHFGPFANHRAVRRMRFGPGYERYMSVRENSAAYVFEGDRIVHGGVYGDLFRPNRFEQYRADLESFARESGFRAFYERESAYFAGLREVYRQRMDVDGMRTWLEDRFPERYDSYRIVFSPLLGQSHSTTRFEDGGFTQCVMFVPGPTAGPTTGDAAYDLARRQVLVFTEIDHNYVNPATARHVDAVERSMRPLPAWNNQPAYRTKVATFNEYMTWSVYLLYAEDEYELEPFKRIARVVERTMERDRGFPNFGAFHVVVRDVYRGRGEGELIPDLYPEILRRIAQSGPNAG